MLFISLNVCSLLVSSFFIEGKSASVSSTAFQAGPLFTKIIFIVQGESKNKQTKTVIVSREPFCKVLN